MLSKFENTTDKDNLDNTLSKIDIVIRGDNEQGKIRNISTFIMRYKERYNKEPYVITNRHIYCTKDTYEIFQKQLHIRSIMN